MSCLVGCSAGAPLAMAPSVALDPRDSSVAAAGSPARGDAGGGSGVDPRAGAPAAGTGGAEVLDAQAALADAGGVIVSVPVPDAAQVLPDAGGAPVDASVAMPDAAVPPPVDAGAPMDAAIADRLLWESSNVLGPTPPMVPKWTNRVLWVALTLIPATADTVVECNKNTVRLGTDIGHTPGTYVDVYDAAQPVTAAFLACLQHPLFIESMQTRSERYLTPQTNQTYAMAEVFGAWNTLGIYAALHGKYGAQTHPHVSYLKREITYTDATAYDQYDRAGNVITVDARWSVWGH